LSYRNTWARRVLRVSLMGFRLVHFRELMLEKRKSKTGNRVLLLCRRHSDYQT
jgi:hypothetical protein